MEAITTEDDELEILLDDHLSIENIDWTTLFDGVDEVDDLLLDPSSLFGEEGEVPVGQWSSGSSDASSSSPAQIDGAECIRFIEEFLMKDDDEGDDGRGGDVEKDMGVFGDLMLDIPVQSNHEASDHSEVVEASSPDCDKNSSSSSNEDSHVLLQAQLPQTNNNNNVTVDAGADEDDDPITKKRRRQLRNRDAAVKSRERKKMRLKDLEMKSRYLEAECRRLGRLLQCCYAENHMLRLSLPGGNAFDASRTKQESAVLLLESLLLGSLLWFLGIMCLLPLPSLLQLKLQQGAAELGNRENKEQGSVAPRGAGSELASLWLVRCPFRSKRCKSSRRKIKINVVSRGMLDCQQLYCAGDPLFMRPPMVREVACW